MSLSPSTSSTESFLDYQGPAVVRQASVDYTEPGPNVVAQIIKSGTPKPHATVSNSMVAAVDRYSPPPGINLPHYMALDVDKAKDNPTTVVDAIQRYMNVRPRREPIADPQDVASTDSHPSLIIDEVTNYNELKPYHYSVNGNERKTDTGTFYSDSGHMQVRIVGTGVTSISTPATEAEDPQEVGPMSPDSSYYPPAYASQMAVNKLAYLFDPSHKMPVIKVGPDLARGLNDTMSAVAYTLGPMRAMLGSMGSRYTQSGSNAYSSLGGYGSTPELNNAVINLNTV